MKKTIKCLLIEDDIDDQEIFQMCQKQANPDVECRISNNGVEAIQLLTVESQYIPDVIFIDVNMPKMNGIECLKKIRDMETFKTTSIYMYSTSSETSVVKQAKQLGANDFIVKPAKTTELIEILSHLFSVPLTL